MFRRILFLLAALCLLLPLTIKAATTPVPVVEVNSWPNGTVNIDHGWLAKKGDDAAYASPGFDDSGWQRLAGAESFPVGPGYRWYRLHLRVPEKHPPLGLLLIAPENGFEVFVNGQSVGDFRIRSQFTMDFARYHAVPLPDSPRDLVVAVRLLQTPYVDTVAAPGHDPYTIASIGLLRFAKLLQDARQMQEANAEASSLWINLALCVGGIAVLGLFWMQRTQTEYLWLGAYLLLQGLDDLAFSLSHFGVAPYWWNALLGDPVLYLVLLLQVEFTFAFVQRRVNWGWRLYEILLVGAWLVAMPINWYGLSAAGYLAFETAMQIPASIGLPLALMIWFRRGNREAGWLIFPSLLPGFTSAMFNLEYIWVFFLNSHRLDALKHIDLFSIGPYPMRLMAVGNLIFLLAIGIVLFFRYTRVARAQMRTAAELDAAREIQRKLVPAELPLVENYGIAATYAPAAEVGGDFYQVLRQADGSVLIALGDVSGKGLKAAMTGSVVIGALRALAAEGGAPGELMEKLNRQVVASGQDGFVTLVCMRLEKDGTLTVSNAGHLHPYWNGEEVEVDSGFPLGVTADARYEEQRVRLAPGDAFTLLSDGVVEARNASGELFGFERTQAMSQSSPEEIAEAAQGFGQEDDITVVRLSFSPVRESSRETAFAYGEPMADTTAAG